MRKLIFITLVFASFLADAQSWTPIYGRQRFTSGLGIPVKDSIAFSSVADTALIYINPNDTSSLWWKYKGAHKKIGGGSGTTTIQQAIDNGDEFNKNNTLNANGYDFKIDNLKSFVLDSAENTFLYSDTKGVFTITNIEGGATQKLQFENQPGHFTISHANGNPFVKFDRGDSSIKMYNSSTLAVRDTIAYLRDVRASGGGADSAIYKTVWRARQDSLVHVAAINFKINKSDSAVGGYYPYSSNPLGYITSASIPAAANPSTSLGLSSVNGSATTFMRSDAAPALSQSITPTWTGIHTFNPTLNASSGVANGVIINPSLAAIANGDKLHGLFINPSFSTGGNVNVGFITLKLRVGTGATGVQLISGENSAGTEVFGVDNTGAIKIGNTLNTISGSTSNGVSISNQFTASYNAIQTLIVNGASPTTGNRNILLFSHSNGGFQPTSGTASLTGLRIEPVINQTGTASGAIRGIYYNPTLTSILGTHTAFENTTGNVLLNTTSGSVGIGANTSINASAILDITSTSKGLLLPRMTGIQAEAISSPADGLLIYCNNGNGSTVNSTGFWGYTGGWVKLN